MKGASTAIIAAKSNDLSPEMANHLYKRSLCKKLRSVRFVAMLNSKKDLRNNSLGP